MAIRLRQVVEWWVALCAVVTDQKEGDVYLDDGMHHALACKFAREWDYWQDDHINRLMDSQKVRDAKEELLKWIANK